MAETPDKSVGLRETLEALAEQFCSMAAPPPPLADPPRGDVWAVPGMDPLALVGESAMRRNRAEYDRALSEAGAMLAAIGRLETCEDERAKIYVAAHDLGSWGGLVRSTANLFSLYVGGPIAELRDSSGTAEEYELHGDGYPPQFRPAQRSFTSRKITARLFDEPRLVCPERCGLYASACRRLAETLPAAYAQREVEDAQPEIATKKSLPPSREKAWQLYNWAITQDPGPTKHTDAGVYEFLKKTQHLDADDLPGTAESFAAMLREARRHYGVSKNQPRSGRDGRNIHKKDEI